MSQPVDLAAGMQRVLELGAEFALDAIAQTLADDAVPAWVLARIAEVRDQVIAHARTLLVEVPEAPERIDERTPAHGAITVDERRG